MLQDDSLPDHQRRVFFYSIDQSEVRFKPGQPVHVGGDDVRVVPGHVIVSKVIRDYHDYVWPLPITAGKTDMDGGTNEQQKCRKIHFWLQLKLLVWWHSRLFIMERLLHCTTLHLIDYTLSYYPHNLYALQVKSYSCTIFISSFSLNHRID